MKRIGTGYLMVACTVAMLAADFQIAGSANADEATEQQTDVDFVRDAARRLGVIERRIKALEENLSRTFDLRDPRDRRMRTNTPRSTSRELGTRAGDFGVSGDEYSRIKLKLDRLQDKAHEAERQLNRHEAEHVAQRKADTEDSKARKSRRRVESRISAIENDLDRLERDARYVR